MTTETKRGYCDVCRVQASVELRQCDSYWCCSECYVGKTAPHEVATSLRRLSGAVADIKAACGHQAVQMAAMKRELEDRLANLLNFHNVLAARITKAEVIADENGGRIRGLEVAVKASQARKRVAAKRTKPARKEHPAVDWW